jgi:adenylate kinase family enzyme
MILCILGAPGAGKSTLASKLSTRFGFKHISAGDVARDLAEIDPEVKAELAEGRLAPREKMNMAMEMVIDEAVENETNIILDGFPRYQAQLDLLSGVDALYLLLSVSEEVAMARLLKRARSDDKAAQIAERMNTFHDETRPLFMPLIRSERGYLITSASADDVFNAAHAFIVHHGFLPAGMLGRPIIEVNDAA